MNRSLLTATLLGALTLATAVPAAASPTTKPGYATATTGTFTEYGRHSNAITYNSSLVPEGSNAAVAAVYPSDSSYVLLAVHGLVPNRSYGAHAHVNSCGASGANAGPHYQNVVDPKPGTSTDPDYANPRNEIWLDFTTDAQGNAVVSTNVAWHFREGGAKSVVIHEHHTATAPGEAGGAGSRLACINMPF
ncbi:hypothetical protein GCM10012275_50160 [Longimycelium tulufanense]|uniref:Superoxide dismutase n=1 Tax=Longimycelium tulufanense TaxID=907463 RepID=A0A8J3CIX0_9PSEU|nr:superoxide dismutase family protein [Longimycelium tulufanense]GGM73468.1 hypothetical protein GCM10012275_50160 [Longimycelium tulufanense]